jgi:hypothetical protein
MNQAYPSQHLVYSLTSFVLKVTNGIILYNPKSGLVIAAIFKQEIHV